MLFTSLYVSLSAACLAAVLCISGNISPGLAGLCLVYALDLTRYLKHGTAMASKTESDFNSVERVVQYLQVSVENLFVVVALQWASRTCAVLLKARLQVKSTMSELLARSVICLQKQLWALVACWENGRRARPLSSSDHVLLPAALCCAVCSLPPKHLRRQHPRWLPRCQLDGQQVRPAACTSCSCSCVRLLCRRHCGMPPACPCAQQTGPVERAPLCGCA